MQSEEGKVGQAYSVKKEEKSSRTAAQHSTTQPLQCSVEKYSR